MAESGKRTMEDMTGAVAVVAWDGSLARTSGLMEGDGPQVVLAPMAGITNAAFRTVCREASAAIAPGFGAARYVSEMITSRGLIERHAKTMRLVQFAPTETYRSLQIFGVDPAVMGEAAAMIAAEDLADHIDINFGCPVPKVTRKGGGAALPWKTPLFRAIIAAAVRNAVKADGTRLPVTVKMRVGVDGEHLTYIDAGLAAAEEGVAWVALHGRTAEQLYSGVADWQPIGHLVDLLQPHGVPVLGNGDIWTAQDAVRMIEHTGCAGVVIGRGCLGRPWLFGQIAAALAGDPVPADPGLAFVARWLRAHAAAQVEAYAASADERDGFSPEMSALRDMRKHMGWYLKGYSIGSRIRAALSQVESLAELDALLAQIDTEQPADADISQRPRGRTSSVKTVSVPQGWLDSREVPADFAMAAAESDVSGG